MHRCTHIYKVYKTLTVTPNWGLVKFDLCILPSPCSELNYIDLASIIFLETTKKKTKLELPQL